MENRNSRISFRRKVGHLRRLLFDVRFLSLAALLAMLITIAGCGAPGEPVAPAPQIPTPISDLAANQSGDAVQLTFTLPARTTKGERLLESPAVEILRGSLKPDGSPEPKSFRVIFTIPGAMVENYVSDDKFHFLDHIPADALRAANPVFAYRIRTRASRKHPSADSNTVLERIFPVPERLTSVSANVTETAIELTWQSPSRSTDGKPVSNFAGYHIYRGQLDPASASAAGTDISQAKWLSPLAFLSSSSATSFRDTNFDFDKTYLYSVRSAITIDNKPLESTDSVPAIVTPRDAFAPAVPQGLVANVVSPTPEAPSEVDLSWSINSEADLAGYRVYRSEQQDIPGQLITPDLLLSPAYRDTSVQPGHRYWYFVTSLDRSGNESARSAPVAVDISQPSS